MSCGGGEVAASGCELFGAGQGQPRNPGSAPGRDGPPRPRRPPATGSGRDDWPALPRHARTCPATTSGRVRPAHRGTAASRSSATSRRPTPPAQRYARPGQRYAPSTRGRGRRVPATLAWAQRHSLAPTRRINVDTPSNTEELRIGRDDIPPADRTKITKNLGRSKFRDQTIWLVTFRDQTT